MSVQGAQQPPPAKQGFFYGYVIAWSSFVVMMVAWGVYYTFGVFFQPVLTEFGWTRAMTSGAFSLSTLLRGCFGIGAGKLNDRFGPRIITVGCGFFLGLSYFLMSQLTAIWQLYLFFGVILAIGMSAAFIPLLSTVARWFVRRRGAMTGFVMMGVGIGIMVIPPIARWLIATYGWRISYMIVGVSCLLIIVLAGQFLKREAAEMGQSPYGSDRLKEKEIDLNTGSIPFQKAVRATQLWLLCAMYFCFLFASSTVVVHVVPHAMDLGMSAAGAANILAAIGAVSLIGRLGLGAVADRFGNKSAIAIGFALLATALVYLPLAKEAWMLYLFTIVYGLAHGALFTLFSPIVAELFGLRSHGVIFGVITFVGTIGGAIGPVLAGYIFDITSSYRLGFFTCGAIAATGLILTFLVRPIAIGNSESG